MWWSRAGDDRPLAGPRRLWSGARRATRRFNPFHFQTPPPFVSFGRPPFAASLAFRRRRASLLLSPILLPSRIVHLAVRHDRRAAKNPRAGAGRRQSLRHTASRVLATLCLGPGPVSSSSSADAEPAPSTHTTGSSIDRRGGAPTSLREARPHFRELGARSV
jgi:hypothetical protein